MDYQQYIDQNRLSFLQKRKWLHIGQIAALVCDRDPTIFYTNDEIEAGLMKEAGHEVELIGFDDPYGRFLSLLYESVENNEITMNNKGLILTTEIKEWLHSKGLKPSFFFPEEIEEQVNKETSRPEYQTKMMDIMYDTIDRYYGDNYDPENSDTIPRQTDVIEWLKETHSLSDAKAKAIDKMTRPPK